MDRQQLKTRIVHKGKHGGWEVVELSSLNLERYFRNERLDKLLQFYRRLVEAQREAK